MLQRGRWLALAFVPPITLLLLGLWNPSPAGPDADAEKALKQLASDEPDARARAAYVLGELRYRAAIGPLIELLGQNEHRDVAAEAATALGKIGGPRAVAALDDALAHPDEKVSNRAAKALIHIGADAADPALRKLGDDDAGARSRALAARVLGRLKVKKAATALVRALGAKSPELRCAAALALMQIGDKRAVSPLIELLGEDPSAKVRVASALALRRLKAEAAVEALLEAIDDPDESVRTEAISSLGALGDRRALDPLIGILRTEVGFPKAAAAFALGKFKDEKAVKVLIPMLGDPDARVRYGAAQSLGEIGDRAALDALNQALAKEKKAHIKVALQQSIREIERENAH